MKRKTEPRVLALVLAGGEGRRLRPLTDDRAKPAIDVTNGYRIVDFVLANLANSGVRWIYVLAQYKPQALVEHLARVWRPALERRRGLLETLLPEGENEAYRGTADAVYRNLRLLAQHEPDIVAVFAADHVYRMDVRQMCRFHLQQHADVTIAACPVPIETAPRFGIMQADVHGRVERFQEKPPDPAPMPGDPRHAFASMGNYLFDPIALFDLLELHERPRDFGQHVLPHAVASGARVFAYDFSNNRVPGLKPYEEAAYWRDVGTVQALAEARHDLEGPTPRLDTRNPDWPLRPN